MACQHLVAFGAQTLPSYPGRHSLRNNGTVVVPAVAVVVVAVDKLVPRRTLVAAEELAVHCSFDDGPVALADSVALTAAVVAELGFVDPVVAAAGHLLLLLSSVWSSAVE